MFCDLNSVFIGLSTKKIQQAVVLIHFAQKASEFKASIENENKGQDVNFCKISSHSER